MRVALLADIHGNAPALRAVLEDAKKLGVDELWFLGDVMGYGPLPISCINLLDEWEPTVWLMGNHDLAALQMWKGTDVGDQAIRYLAPGEDERLVALWHAKQLEAGLPARRIQKLKECPAWQRANAGIYAAHGAVLSADPHEAENIGPNAYCNPWSLPPDLMLDTILRLHDEALPRLIVVGHTHIPAHGRAKQWEKPRGWEWEAGEELYEPAGGPKALLENGDRLAMICPGSVGVPRNVKDTNAAYYAVLETVKWTVEFRRIPYNRGEFEAAKVPMPRHLYEILARQHSY